MLDFVPNHMALDHPWVESTRVFRRRGPARPGPRARRITRGQRRGGDRLLAHGRDPYFPGWPDTFQLNYGNRPRRTRCRRAGHDRRPVRRRALRHGDARAARGLRRTWGSPAAAVWPAIAARARAGARLLLMAEVYWDLEWNLQHQGFDSTYDKRLYDRLQEGTPGGPGHSAAGLGFQDKLARFLENHDEPRAAANSPGGMHRAAAFITYLAPGLRFFHQGQSRAERNASRPTSSAARTNPPMGSSKSFLRPPTRRPSSADRPRRPMAVARTRPRLGWQPDPRLLPGFRLARPEGRINYRRRELRPSQSQCHVRVPFSDLAGAGWRFESLLGDGSYDRDGARSQERGVSSSTSRPGRPRPSA